MPSSYMVTYVGPKRHMYVPFGEDNTFPVESASSIVDTIRFERGQMVELNAERALALVQQSPDVFKLNADVTVPRKVSKPAPKLASDGPPNTETVRVTNYPKEPYVEELTEGEFNALSALSLPVSK